MPNLHDAAVTMVARDGDAARFERFRALFAKETDPAFRRRYLLELDGKPEAAHAHLVNAQFTVVPLSLFVVQRRLCVTGLFVCSRRSLDCSWS